MSLCTPSKPVWLTFLLLYSCRYFKECFNLFSQIKSMGSKTTLLFIDFFYMEKREKKNWRVQENQNIEKIAFKVVQMNSSALHTTNKKLRFDIHGRKFTKYLHGTWSSLIILMIFGIKKNLKCWPIQCIIGYCYKYIHATYDLFCGPGSYKYIGVCFTSKNYFILSKISNFVVCYLMFLFTYLWNWLIISETLFFFSLLRWTSE